MSLDRNRMTGVTLLLLILFIASCEDPVVPVPICSDEYRYGLEIRVVDKETGGPTGLGAWAVVTDGEYEELALCEDRGPLGVAALAAGERAGTYTISIEAEGYLEWRREGVRVTADRCHVRTVEIIAELEPDPLSQRLNVNGA